MTRWILAFDATCSSCESISKLVTEAVAGTALEPHALAEPEIVELRRQAFGEQQPPWLPTLLAWDKERVRAWTGPALSMRLARLLGPAQSVCVARAVARAHDNIGFPADGLWDRRRLLKAIPGVAAGAFVLSGGTAFAESTRQAGPPASGVTPLHGPKAAAARHKVANDRSVVELGKTLGIDPRKALENSVVEQLPRNVEGVSAPVYVAVSWILNPIRSCAQATLSRPTALSTATSTGRQRPARSQPCVTVSSAARLSRSPSRQLRAHNRNLVQHPPALSIAYPLALASARRSLRLSWRAAVLHAPSLWALRA